VIDAVSVADQRVGEAGEIDETVPVGVVASEPRHLETKAARGFREAMGQRLQQFALALHPDKTRLIEFGRLAVAQRGQRGLGKPETFNFLGFTFICGKSRRGRFLLKRMTRRDRMRAKLDEVKGERRRRMHQSVPDQGQWLRQIVTGYLADHAVPTNARALGRFRNKVIDLWRRTLRRRSQKDRTTWMRMSKLAADFLPKPPHSSSLAQRPLLRQAPEVGAECPNRARSDLCGGQIGLHLHIGETTPDGARQAVPRLGFTV
jgi:hypothetical protein